MVSLHKAGDRRLYAYARHVLDQLDQIDGTCYVGQVDQQGGAMFSTYNLYDAKTRLSELVDRAASGEEIVIAKNGRPLARLVPIPAEKPNRSPGGWEGMVWIADDFDEPLPADIQRVFEGDDEGTGA
jgi:prevent-host-death family protein